MGILGLVGMLGSLLTAYGTDPGIIPRGPKAFRTQHSKG